jgi:CRISPR-associated endonuclease/helicase Cas3
VPASPSIDLIADPAGGTEDPYRADPSSVAQLAWVGLDQHSEDTRDHAAALLSAIGPALPDCAARSAVTAAYLHDLGKAHKIWQDALCSLAPEDRRDEIAAGRPWAKSGTDKPLRFEGGVAFRHELASLLFLDGPLNNLLGDAPDVDLARYLVLAHHGKLRVQVRDPGDLGVLAAGEASEQKLLGLEQGTTTDIPLLLGRPATQFTVNLEQFRLGGERSWTRTALGLLDRYGPFVLAYLEAIVRVADWRASAGSEMAR